MTVTSKWVALHEVSDYLAKGWREVKLEGGFKHVALMVSPEEPASDGGNGRCDSTFLPAFSGFQEHHHCRLMAGHAGMHEAPSALGGNPVQWLNLTPASEPAKVEWMRRRYEEPVTIAGASILEAAIAKPLPSDPAKAECPNCKKTLREYECHYWYDSGGLLYDCKPAEPVAAVDEQERFFSREAAKGPAVWSPDCPAEPVVAEMPAYQMPEDLRRWAWRAVEMLRVGQLNAEDKDGKDGGRLFMESADKLAAAIRNHPRTHAAQPANAEKIRQDGFDDGYLAGRTYERTFSKSQPAKVRMTPAVEKILEAYDEANDLLARYLPPDSGISDREVVNGMLGIFDNKTQIDARATVRAQAAEAGKVKLPKVREFAQRALAMTLPDGVRPLGVAALAELDAAEGRNG